jgi:hypothetical protein
MIAMEIHTKAMDFHGYAMIAMLGGSWRCLEAGYEKASQNRMIKICFGAKFSVIGLTF